MNTFEITTLTICACFVVRNTIALIVGLKYTDYVYKYNQDSIRNDWANYPNNMLKYEPPFFSHCYYMLDIRKWTFKQFHPHGITK